MSGTTASHGVASMAEPGGLVTPPYRRSTRQPGAQRTHAAPRCSGFGLNHDGPQMVQRGLSPVNHRLIHDMMILPYND